MTGGRCFVFNHHLTDSFRSKKSTKQALAEWLCTKHLELRDAWEIGDPSVVAKLSQLLATGLENANFVVRGRFHGGEFSEVKVLHGRSKREEAWYGCEPRGLAKPVTQVHRQNARVPEDVLDALQYDLTQDHLDLNAQVNQRSTTHPTFNKVWSGTVSSKLG